MYLVYSIRFTSLLRGTALSALLMSFCLTFIILYFAAYLVELCGTVGGGGGALKCGSPHDAFLGFTSHLHQAQNTDGNNTGTSACRGVAGEEECWLGGCGFTVCWHRETHSLDERQHGHHGWRPFIPSGSGNSTSTEGKYGRTCSVHAQTGGRGRNALPCSPTLTESCVHLLTDFCSASLLSCSWTPTASGLWGKNSISDFCLEMSSKQ